MIAPTRTILLEQSHWEWELSLKQVFKPRLFSCDKWLFLLCICDRHKLFDFPFVIVLLFFFFCMLLWLFLKKLLPYWQCFISLSLVFHLMGFPGSSDGKDSAYNTGDLGSIPVLGISPGGGHGNPHQYSCLEKPVDRGAWWVTVHGVTKSRSPVKDYAHHSTVLHLIDHLF